MLNAERTWLYTLARVILGFVYRVFFRAKARGVENYPKDQNCIILGNHVSAWDPLSIGVFFKHSEIHFMAKESLFQNPLLRALLTGLHGFPVHRGETDMAAMRTAMQVLREGKVLGIFPEGSRRQEIKVERIETGVAVLALKTNVPLIPVFVGGTYRLFGGVRVVVGAPVPLDDLRQRRADSETLEMVKARIIQSLEALRPLSNF